MFNLACQFFKIQNRKGFGKKSITIIVLIFIVITGSSFAQIRYSADVFTDISKGTHTYLKKDSEDLKVDVYSPAKDQIKKRPLLLYVHGGGFSGGARDLPKHEQFCRNLAIKGYVTATMSYTLVRKGKSFGCETPASEKRETFLLTARDVSYAVKFFTDNSEKFGIDTDKIVIIGSSAGAEAVLHAAYWKQTQRSTDEKILPDSFRYGGVISMAGALTDIEWVNKSSAIPTQLFHGTCDNLVPYSAASHHYCEADTPGYLLLYGAYSIAEKLKKLGKPYSLMTGCGGGHEWNDAPLDKYFGDVVDFLYHDVVKGEKRQIHQVKESNPISFCKNVPSFDFCEN